MNPSGQNFLAVVGGWGRGFRRIDVTSLRHFGKSLLLYNTFFDQEIAELYCFKKNSEENTGLNPKKLWIFLTTPKFSKYLNNFEISRKLLNIPNPSFVAVHVTKRHGEVAVTISGHAILVSPWTCVTTHWQLKETTLSAVSGTRSIVEKMYTHGHAV